MKTIDTKLAIVKACRAAAGWSDAQLRNLIHATGGSPRRAKRLLNSDAAQAEALSESFAEQIAAGVPFATALRAAQAAWPSFAPAQEPAPEADPEEEEETEGVL